MSYPSVIMNIILFLHLFFSGVFSANSVFNTFSKENREKNLILEARGFTSITNDIIDWLFIMPGTKWCGVGDRASDYNDLGTYEDEDKCCREHDHCQDYINPLKSKNDLLNTNAIYAKLSCQCDLQFLNCLKDLNSTFSEIVGNIYFNKIGTECFQLDYPILKCLKYDILPAVKCVKYLMDESQPKKFQWFDVPNYPSNQSPIFQSSFCLIGILLLFLVNTS